VCSLVMCHFELVENREMPDVDAAKLNRKRLSLALFSSLPDSEQEKADHVAYLSEKLGSYLKDWKGELEDEKLEAMADIQALENPDSTSHLSGIQALKSALDNKWTEKRNKSSGENHHHLVDMYNLLLWWNSQGRK